MNTDLQPTRLSAADVARVAASGLRARPTRVILSALGIAIGIAAMIAVIGLSTSGRAQLQAQLDKLGTNLLQVTPGTDFQGQPQPLPATTRQSIMRIDPVLATAASGLIPNTSIYRSDAIPTADTGGLGVYAADLNLTRVLQLKLTAGTWLNAATQRYPAVVLGSTTAQQLGIDHAGRNVTVNINGTTFVVVGILGPSALATDLDRGALIGWDAARALTGKTVGLGTVYVRAAPAQVPAVRKVLGATVSPQAPSEVTVSRPSDALGAQNAADNAFTGLLLGVGAVALLVGGVGVANTMIISVLERRGEIGLRRSLGATRGHIRSQFLVESLLLALIGGLAGMILGVTATTIYARLQGWPVVVPIWATLGGLAATVLVGIIAGLYPSTRAARLSPTEALSSP